MKNINNIIKSIVILSGITMLLSCENSIKEVQSITSNEKNPERSGKDVEFIFTDSTRIKYRAFAVEFIDVKTEDKEYQDFPKGGKITSYDDDGTVAGQIEANYAKHFTSDQLWELRNKVIAVSDDGKTINTELMYWDQGKGLIYSDQYVRITTDDGQVLEGIGFSSDDKMDKITLKKVTGEVYLNDETEQ
ncbi:LPS export ABC transporter periplasmic protein LptC [Labilibaculum sp. A4]|uniref:LPS export ABC transporter periplasmic protein LptC n=1 Tax=Labilibaculum euxinus TaxID=2686357 RepID=UPI000F61C4CA|nr:LPS export ABC transporter periplasmic protein LptC [Labilibaculum euxinus]MDQ1772144.1 LPS export ABC transporter periplasmic protein LptC [Labilibaculum euxinus]MWN77847.1 LPS export ABC transporter periplasmic protein LptC [Labilibaculum euxinus]